MSFIEIADQRLLSSVKAHLGDLTWDVDADGYQRLRVPAAADVETLLRLLLRRGLDPSLTSLLVDRFVQRPLERALIAWDIAAGSLLGTEDAALTQRLRSLLAPLKRVGTLPSVAVPRDRVGALIEAATAIGEQPMPQPSLSSLAAVNAGDSAAIDAALAFAEQLALAHLPSLALAFAQILWTRLALPKALDLIVETALDYERFDSIPVMPEQDDRSILRQTYFGMRVALAQLDTASAAAILAQMSQHPAVTTASDPALTVAKAELALLSDQPLPYGADEPIASIATSTWRYASRVRDELQIQLAPQNAVGSLEGFLTSFGNDMRVWAQAASHPEMRADLLALVSREVRYCSFDPDAWRALAVFLDDGSEVELELQQRSATQLATALGGNLA
jgi:hypothetical protein